MTDTVVYVYCERAAVGDSGEQMGHNISRFRKLILSIEPVTIINRKRRIYPVETDLVKSVEYRLMLPTDRYEDSTP